LSTEAIISGVISKRKSSPRDKLYWVHVSRKGLDYSNYGKIFAQDEPFTLSEWARILNVNIRTLERYKKGKKKLQIPVSDKFLEVTQLLNRGIEVFGEWEKFRDWMNTENLSLGKNKPKELLDTSFGIAMVKDELARIEYGIFV
jgi:putative toxin-antitoxin system antitoxin component (TIGR02293 family)